MPSDNDSLDLADSELDGLDAAGVEKKLRMKAIEKRQQDVGLSFTEFVYKKKKTMELRKEYLDVTDEQAKAELNIESLRSEYMRKKKYKHAIDAISFAEFFQLHSDRARFIENTRNSSN